MIAKLHNAQHDELCRVLSIAASNVPTLRLGRAVFGLAMHIWTLNHEPLTWAGMPLSLFSWLTDREARRTKERFSYAELIEEIRTDPTSFARTPTDPREGRRHPLGEHFIHTGDTRRSNRLPKQEISPDLAEVLWWRLRMTSWQLHPFVSWEFRTPQGSHRRVGRGPVTKQITDEPGELLMWVYGCTEAVRAEIAKS